MIAAAKAPQSRPPEQASPPMTLPDRLVAALDNLARKKAGEEVDWINIADARALTDLGLAQRSREGWDITAAGATALAARGANDTDRLPPDTSR